MRKWPYCMKKKNPKPKCVICGKTREDLQGKSMPGLYKGKCSPCYTLTRRYGKAGVAGIVRAHINLRKALRAVS